MTINCTCTNTNCPLHPTKHDKGCTPCIQKNLRLKELPSCYFNLVTENGSAVEDCSLSSFAHMVLEQNTQSKV